MGGQVTLRSAVGMGSTFAFQASLPRVDDSASVPASDVAVVRPVDLFEENIAEARNRVGRSLRAESGTTLMASFDSMAFQSSHQFDAHQVAHDDTPSTPGVGTATGVGAGAAAGEALRQAPPRVVFHDELKTLVEIEINGTSPTGAGASAAPASADAGAPGADAGAGASDGAGVPASGGTSSVMSGGVPSKDHSGRAGAAATAQASGHGQHRQEGGTPVRQKILLRKGSSGVTSTDAAPHLPIVLIVDDSVVNQRLIERWVHKSKLQVHCVVGEDGLEAVSLWRQHRARLCCILMDVNMPRMNGIDATKYVDSVV